MDRSVMAEAVDASSSRSQRAEWFECDNYGAERSVVGTSIKALWPVQRRAVL